MAEAGEGQKPVEYIVRDPDALKHGVRDRTTGILDKAIDKSPLMRSYATWLQSIHGALPEGAAKTMGGRMMDVLKVPMTGSALALETVKVLPLPIVGVMARGAEAYLSTVLNIGSKIMPHVVESGPARFAVGSVDAVAERIWGGGEATPTRRHSEPMASATPENARMILVNMSRPELGKQERRKMT
ncbi:hypothetical protein A2973_05740 [Candidatus Gottesmanbacteria bacterium RIFCSPLOWO2_01_FULL_49_10]|uniref:Uncharacterized protein n=1 Tax=Candidatus Gottesmanbacteria bacterium RIFCSPLOWO2_01_FULL_49_10 TaxID=1798396 RepID=A0A1F6B0V2_9BACT|nr:MAG: hypothetical protein A2973_05740 [Candidatus Gottesmanbacteria bacterium RIFCSPLOWO2_01_FULL_49_10]